MSLQTTSSADHHEEAASSALTIVVEAGTVAAATMTIIVDLATMIASDDRTDDVMTMVLAASIAMPPRAAMIVTAAVAMIAVVAMNTTVGTPDGQATRLHMASRRRQETIETLMAEVEPLTTVLMIGTPVDRLPSANLLRCGALCQIRRPSLSAAHELQITSVSA